MTRGGGGPAPPSSSRRLHLANPNPNQPAPLPTSINRNRILWVRHERQAKEKEGSWREEEEETKEKKKKQKKQIPRIPPPNFATPPANQSPIRAHHVLLRAHCRCRNPPTRLLQGSITLPSPSSSLVLISVPPPSLLVRIIGSHRMTCPYVHRYSTVHT